MNAERESAGDALPPGCEVIAVHLAELKQLFNAMDPSPFREKDLSPSAEQFIVGWAPRYSHWCARRSWGCRVQRISRAFSQPSG